MNIIKLRGACTTVVAEETPLCKTSLRVGMNLQRRNYARRLPHYRTIADKKDKRLPYYGTMAGKGQKDYPTVHLLHNTYCEDLSFLQLWQMQQSRLLGRKYVGASDALSEFFLFWSAPNSQVCVQNNHKFLATCFSNCTGKTWRAKVCVNIFRYIHNLTLISHAPGFASYWSHKLMELSNLAEDWRIMQASLYERRAGSSKRKAASHTNGVVEPGMMLMHHLLKHWKAPTTVS